MVKKTKLQVTVDKSHIITIGERLYTKSIELIRELINNAYDADATRVEVTIDKKSIVVKDNGSGMDLDGLKQYFNIGSPYKKIESKSPVFGRERIGEFGIGKFASLTAGRIFTVETHCGDFSARVVFDKKKWSKKKRWNLPLEILKKDKRKGNGTIVTITELQKQFDPSEVSQWIRERIPLKAEKFSVFINGHKLSPKRFGGYRIPVFETCPFGLINGEIVILPLSKASQEDMGIEVKVKHVTIRKELFGLETWGKEALRIRGEVNADFLPITSDRSGFIEDSKEYTVFLQKIEQVMKDVKRELKRISGERERRKARKALKEALKRIEKALGMNPEFAPLSATPFGEENGMGEPAVVKSEKKQKLKEKEMEAEQNKEKNKKQIKSQGKETQPRVRRLNPRAISRRINFKGKGINCCLDHFGQEGPETFTEGSVVYINQDHLLYKKSAKKQATLILHIARLLSQEISLLNSPESPRKAFDNQSDLLKDAFKEDKM